MSFSKLEPYELSGEKLELLQRCFSEAEPETILRMYQKRPKPSELRQRFEKELSAFCPAQMLEATLRSVLRTWETFHESSVSPGEFMRTPFGASYEIVSVAGKGRGIIASRDIKAGEVILQDTPIIVLPQPAIALFFLTLPQKALEAILLLHNAHPDEKNFSASRDTTKHRLLDYLVGIMTTNSFGTTSVSRGAMGVLLLTGSLFNHSKSPNLSRRWDDASEKQIFTSVRDIKKGEELEIDYLPGAVGKVRAEGLKNYGTGLS